MMRKATLWAVAAAGFAGLALAVPAGADVKAGVEAWSRGEYKKAVDIWRTDANRGDADAQFNLGQAYRFGRGVPVDLPAAATWFRKAALQGHVEAETNFGLTLFDQNRHAEALPWLEKSVARGEPRAQMALGTMLYNGDGVRRDFPRAYALLVRSAASGLPRAAQVQAEMDQNIPLADRQKGLEIAKQYEAEARRPVLPPDITRASEHMMQVTELPPSTAAGGSLGESALMMTPVRPKREAMAEKTGPPRQSTREPVIAPNGGWRVQLGAFGEADNARKLWGQVKGRFPGRQPFYVRAGVVTRLLVGPYASRAEAATACGAVKPCVPVAP